ncbi:DNA-directed RNA polymerase subunit beta, partial [Porphyromonas uenonis]|uniref:DNA-directed RNA polymerase subunit beta n=1 Tax=Porphyromonas uenonis TaxID=281920 RepID=UPI0026EB672C
LKYYDEESEEETGETETFARYNTLVEQNAILDEENAQVILENGIETILLRRDLSTSDQESTDQEVMDYSIIFNTLKRDSANSEQAAYNFIYNLLRNSTPPDDQSAKEIFNNIFFSEKRYDLGDVGRYKINSKLGLDIDPDIRILTAEDIVAIIRHLIKLVNGKAPVDDIDHLSNRRVRTVGEQLYNQFSIGLSRMARTVKERMNVRDSEVFTPVDLVNSKTIASVVNSFFGTNALSQFMDQQNPLSEITHKRRLSALGPGGLTRDRAGFEVRDVHYTHYGRLCPIETPEGPNIGLISSLCVYAKINELGFITTPYRNVDKGTVSFKDSQLAYYTAEEEEDKTVAQGNAPLSEDGHFVRSRVKARYGADFPVVEPSEVDLMDVSPTQIASIAASLIPFLEHDDANRALMGSNMMRQAVPLLTPEAPIVGTGIERRLVSDSRTQVEAEGDGVVVYVDATKIVVDYDRSEEEELVSFEPSEVTYKLPKYRKTNQSTTIDLSPVCRKGDRVTKGQILTQGFSTQDGELALGRNILAAYMPWKGYNYEDAIVLNERVVAEDLFTSVHVDEYSLDVRETKRGMEEFTADIPNVSEEATKDLDTNGIVRVGARIVPGDILVGKITPKGESDPTPEEKLLLAIFGDKAGDVKDASLKASPSLKGVVIDTKLYSRANRKGGIVATRKINQRYEEELSKLQSALKEELVSKLQIILKKHKATATDFVDYIGVVKVKAGTRITKSLLLELDYNDLRMSDWTKDEHTNQLVKQTIANYIKKDKVTIADVNRRKLDETLGDELPSGIIQTAKILIAKKRKIQVGDKMAGRHGNKGIVSKIVRREDMPYLPDGTPVDICLNPLGVPSRMNLGQIFEAVLAWAGRKLGVKFATPIFDGATLDDLNEWTDKAGLPRGGQMKLFDGGTGEPFDQEATVGVTYFLKLGHMVDDKMHARSIGPYSLITQQPLGGKSNFGGQRFGEMEVWALEAFGAAHVLQEILTIKSDDVVGRSKAYEAIVRGDNMPTPGLPESLNVLLNELKGLALSVHIE